MKKTRRTAQVGVSLRDALVEVFRRELKDLDIGMVSITDVEVSPDLHIAHVFLSGLDEKQTRTAVRELQARAGRLRSALGQRIHLRYTPELQFLYDETTMRAGRIEGLLSDIRIADAAQKASESEAGDRDDTTDGNQNDDEQS